MKSPQFSIPSLIRKAFASPSKLPQSAVDTVQLVETTQVAVPKRKTKTQRIIEEIHESFYDASNRILKEAQDILADAAIDESAILKQKLGFTKAKGVEDHLTKESKKATSQKLMKAVSYFQAEYPWFKVITEEQVTEICNKYNLLFAPSSRYKGEIPKKNLLEIEAFNAKMHRIKEDDRRYMERWFMFGDLNKEVSFAHYNARAKQQTGGGYHYFDSRVSQESSYSICAPISDIDTSGMQVRGTRLIEIPDPIVLFPLRDGFYAIVTAWGLEAEDESVVNQKMN